MSLGLGGHRTLRFRLNRSLLSLICSLHKSPCLEPAPTDRSLNRAPTEARVRTADVVVRTVAEALETASGCAVARLLPVLWSSRSPPQTIGSMPLSGRVSVNLRKSLTRICSRALPIGCSGGGRRRRPGKLGRISSETRPTRELRSGIRHGFVS